MSFPEIVSVSLTHNSCLLALNIPCAEINVFEGCRPLTYTYVDENAGYKRKLRKEGNLILNNYILTGLFKLFARRK